MRMSGLRIDRLLACGMIMWIVEEGENTDDRRDGNEDATSNLGFYEEAFHMTTTNLPLLRACETNDLF